MPYEKLSGMLVMTYHYLDEPCLRGRIHRHFCKYTNDPVDYGYDQRYDDDRLFDPEKIR